MFGFEEEDIMVEALPDAEVDPNPAASVVTMLAAASADCVELRKKKKEDFLGFPRICSR